MTFFLYDFDLKKSYILYVPVFIKKSLKNIKTSLFFLSHQADRKHFFLRVAWVYSIRFSILNTLITWKADE